MLKKILIPLLAIFGLLAVAFWGYFKFRQIKAEQNTMPQGTEAIVKVNIDGLFASVIWSCLKHPGQYKSLQKKAFNNQLSLAQTGLKMPASLYLYKIKDGFYTRLSIKDHSIFKNFITKRNDFKVKKSTESDLLTAHSALLGIDMVFDSRHVAISYHPGKQTNPATLNDVFNEKRHVPVARSKFNNINSQKNHLTIAFENNILGLHFKDGAIHFNDELLSDEIVPAAKPKHHTFAPDIPLTMWINADFKPSADGRITEKFSLINALRKSYAGYLDFQWIGTSSKTDTIISYTYNDNFEQTETKTLKKVQIPQVILNMNGNYSALRKSLLDSNRIDSKSGKFDARTIPFLNLYLTGTGNNIQVSGSKNFDSRFIDKLPSENFFEADIDVEKLLQATDFAPKVVQQLQVKRIVASAKSLRKGKIEVEGSIVFKNNKLNSIFQLLDIFGQAEKLDLNLKKKFP